MTLQLYGPVNPESATFIHRPLEGQILQALDRGEYVNLRGGRQSGKTSIIYSLRGELLKRSIASSYVDLSPLPTITADPEPWFRALGEAITAYMAPRDLAEQLPEPPSQLRGFVPYVDAIGRLVGGGKPFVLFIDEVPAVPAVLLRPLFRTIRAMYNARGDAVNPTSANVSFVFAGTFDPGRFIEGETSPFNVAHDFGTSDWDLTSADLIGLARQLGLEDDAGSQVHSWTDGHPYLSNRILDLLSSGSTIDVAVQTTLRSDIHLRHLGRSLGDGGAEAIELASRIKAGVAVQCSLGLTPTLDHLIVIGLLKPGHDGKAKIRNLLYAHFLEHLENARLPDPVPPPTLPYVLNHLAPSPLVDHVAHLLTLADEMKTKSPAFAAVCIGIVLEAVLLLELESRTDLPGVVARVNADIAAKRISVETLRDATPAHWKLAQMIEVARECKLISQPSSQVSHGLRQWRNLVHPDRFRSDYPQGIDADYGEAAVSNAHILLKEIRLHHP